MRGRPLINLPYFAAEVDQETGDLKAGLLLDYWPIGGRLTRILCSLTTPRRSVAGRNVAR